MSGPVKVGDRVTVAADYMSIFIRGGDSGSVIRIDDDGDAWVGWENPRISYDGCAIPGWCVGCEHLTVEIAEGAP